jgi:phage baseplate assembly protein W
MRRKTYPYQGRAYKAIQDELWSLLGRWEHRVEILAAIAHEQRASGRHELAEAYKKQAIESKKHAESVRKLLIGQK